MAANFTSTGSDTFPSGHVIADKVLLQTADASEQGHVSTGSDAYVDSGIAGSFTTVKGSGDSYLVFTFHSGMSHISAAASWGTTAMTLRTSSSTSYGTSDDILDDATPTGAYRNRFESYPGYQPYYFRYIYHAGDSQYPSALTSYSAAQTLYARLFLSEPSGATWYLIHSGSYFNFKVQEIMR